MSKRNKRSASDTMSRFVAMNHSREHVDNLDDKTRKSELAALESILSELKAEGRADDQKKVRRQMRRRNWYRSKVGAFANAASKPNAKKRTKRDKATADATTNANADPALDANEDVSHDANASA